MALYLFYSLSILQRCLGAQQQGCLSAQSILHIPYIAKWQAGKCLGFLVGSFYVPFFSSYKTIFLAMPERTATRGKKLIPTFLAVLKISDNILKREQEKQTVRF